MQAPQGRSSNGWYWPVGQKTGRRVEAGSDADTASVMGAGMQRGAGVDAHDRENGVDTTPTNDLLAQQQRHGDLDNIYLGATRFVPAIGVDGEVAAS